MSFAAVQKHVAVLERAGLVTKVRRGREQLVRTDRDAVGRADEHRQRREGPRSTPGVKGWRHLGVAASPPTAAGGV
jgi:DNA-binding transcriptional ArsR family regulator